MITILEPIQHIYALWGKQEFGVDTTFRLMKYVMRVDYEDKVFLQNTVTRHLIVLNRDEKTIIDSLPVKYSSGIEKLVDWHFLVPMQFDELRQVKKMRYILRKLDDIHRPNFINKYTILTTTACNARCYYCFEHGVETVTMSSQTADDVVEFISSHCGDEKTVRITWFGGEPTVASGRIDQISEGLRRRGIAYSSDMTTNGYLFDKKMVTKAKNLWNLEYLQICFDGLESNHNKIKNYIYGEDNPYQRTLRNIGLLLDEEIRVGLRMNFDIANYLDFKGIVKEAANRFQGNPRLSIYAFPVIGEHPDSTGHILHGSAKWFDEKIAELNEFSREERMYHERQQLPFLRYHCCDAENEAAITITPQGELVRCCQCFGEDQRVGTIWDGITNKEKYLSWEQYADYDKCKNCIYYPSCVRIVNCPGKDRCQFFSEWNMRNARTIKDTYHYVTTKQKNIERDV